MYYKLFRSSLEASEDLSRLSASAVTDSDLRNADKAFDRIDHSES